MKKRYFLPIIALCVVPFCLAADDDDDENKPEPRLQLWQAKLDDTSLITLSVSQIVSVTMHPYKLNGENLVTEVTIDTLGNNTIRFYFVHSDEKEPDYFDPNSVVKDAKKRLSQRPSQPKAKAEDGEPLIASVKFPEGAYAHTIEYQVSCLKTLEEIYKSVTSVWEKATKKRTIYKTTVNN